MKKKLVRLTESDLHKIIKESVKKILKETDDKEKRRKRKGGFDILRKTNWNKYNHEKNFPKNNPCKPHGDYWDEYDKADNERNK